MAKVLAPCLELLGGLADDLAEPEPDKRTLPLQRVMAGGTKTRYHRAVKPGDVLVGTLTLSDIYAKTGSTGPLIFVVYTLHVETADGAPVMDEIQTRIAR